MPSSAWSPSIFCPISFFSFTYTPPSEIYTLSLHDALPIFSIPIFCIGGIKSENLTQVIAAGAKRVVIVSGLLQAHNIAEYARACKKLLRREHDQVTTNH